MTRSIRNSLPFVTALTITSLLGCDTGAGPAGPGLEPEGLSFSYSGAAAGTYQSSGMLTLDTDGVPSLGSWAVARPDSLSGLVVAGFDRTDETKGNLFILQLTRRNPGEYTCSHPGTDGGCHGRLFIGVRPSDPAAVESVFHVTAGTTVLTTVGPDRAIGTFDLTLTRDGAEGEVIVVENGTMDVAFMNDVLLAHGLACLARNLEEGTNVPCD
jgi:hypothetical protein